MCLSTFVFPEAFPAPAVPEPGTRHGTAPADKIPARPMPEAGSHEHHENIDIGTDLSLSASAQRKIQIFPEPGHERHMPSAPEFRDGRSQIGIIKIFRQLEAEHFSQAHSHIGITGKVIIKLKGIEQGGNPGEAAVHISDLKPINRIHAAPEHIRDEHLLRKAVDETPDSLARFLQILPAARSCGPKSRYFSIGPWVIFGKKEKYSAIFRIFFSAGIFPYTDRPDR